MKKLLSIILLVGLSSISYAGGVNSASDGNHNHASSAKASSGVHFYGRLYIGYDSTSGDVQKLDDGGNKSRLGLKIRSGNIIGNLEYKFDIGDGTSGAGNNCGTNNENGCQTFDMHIGNLGFITPLGYIGGGTYEAPYKTMGQFDTNMDTAIALNSHGGFSQGQGGIAGNFEGAIAYHAMMGPLEIEAMYAASKGSNDVTNTDRGDYSVGITAKDMFMNGLTFGFARYQDAENSTISEKNDKVFASFKAMPNMGIFVSLEDLEVVNTFIASSGTDGRISTYGIHYSMGMTDLQFVLADGDSSAAAANQDYSTSSISAKINLSKNSDITIGYTKQDFDADGSDVSTSGFGLTHKF
tara:strand:+ start:439 stop:1500 length:1062 start_codon:yes stop_codon:yes gene_type:complete